MLVLRTFPFYFSPWLTSLLTPFFCFIIMKKLKQSNISFHHFLDHSTKAFNIFCAWKKKQNCIAHLLHHRKVNGKHFYIQYSVVTSTQVICFSELICIFLEYNSETAKHVWRWRDKHWNSVLLLIRQMTLLALPFLSDFWMLEGPGLISWTSSYL